jgi:NAD-dependent SIR2 family protein deacetylase
VSTLTCHKCGNSKGWRNARQDRDGTQTAICARCGTAVRSTGGTFMGTVTGDMSQDR